MGILGFFNSVANQLINRYQHLTDKLTPRSPAHQHRDFNRTTLPALRPSTDTYEPSTATAEASPRPTDTVDLSGDRPAPETGPDASADTAPAAPADEAPTAPAAAGTDGTYHVRRQARLDYRLDLRFDLAAVQRTVRQLSEGDTTALENLVAGGFGLRAAFDLKGSQAVETNLVEPRTEGPSASHARGADMVKARQASEFSAASRDFAVQSFQKESSRLMRTYDVLAKDNYRRAVNQFAFRYRSDSSFSFAFLERFTVQSGRMAEQMPESAEQYVGSAGNVAEMGSSQMMATFLDAVDAYLDDAEQGLLDKALGSFDQAAKELGFAGDTVDIARDHLTGSIESFFDRVDNALGDIRARFVGEPAAAEGPSRPEPAADPQKPVVEPNTADKDPATPMA